jgi:hypothetical protein
MRGPYNCRLVLCMAVLFPAACLAQNPAAELDTAAPSQGEAMSSGIDCGTFAAKDSSLDLISKFCEFALTYRHRLPDFIAQQTSPSANLIPW